TYWYALDYVERDDGSGGNMGMGAGTGTEGQSVYEEYVEKYGKDNADYLMQVMGQWQAHYKRAAYIEMGVGDGSRVENIARSDASQRGWIFEKITGDMV
ncbi:MAG: DUF1638 domain-containing protein, partial [Anaerolineae bacterium]|nr:DUF1638 domain-containing protein [Anaerolineae bacterium]